MRIRRVSFVGVGTDDFDAMTARVRDVLQLESGDRDLVEVYRPGRDDDRLLPAAATGPTVAFAVDDIVAAREEFVAAGVEIVADIVWAAEAFAEPRLEGFGWLFFRAPEGSVYALQQAYAPSDSTDRGAI